MPNVQTEEKSGKLVITIDLSKTLGDSKSGKNEMIGTTSGNQPFASAKAGQIQVGVNVYRKK